MRNKSCGNGSKNCVAFRNAMRNGIAIGNPSNKVNFMNFLFINLTIYILHSSVVTLEKTKHIKLKTISEYVSPKLVDSVLLPVLEKTLLVLLLGKPVLFNVFFINILFLKVR